MRVAVISDVHANLHALEAVLAAVDEATPDAVWCLGDVVGYGPQTEPLLRARGGARRRQPRRQPRSRRDRRDRHLDLLAGCRRSGGLDGRRPHRAGRDYLGSLTPSTLLPRRGALPREPAGSGLGVRPQPRGGAGSDRRRPQRRSSSSATATSRWPSRSSTTSSTVAWRRTARDVADRWREAAQPRLGRPAPRRRSARCLAAPRSSSGRRRRFAGSTTRSSDTGRDPGSRTSREPRDEAAAGI